MSSTWAGLGSRKHLKGWGAAWGNQEGGLSAAAAVALEEIWGFGVWSVRAEGGHTDRGVWKCSIKV